MYWLGFAQKFDAYAKNMVRVTNCICAIRLGLIAHTARTDKDLAIIMKIDDLYLPTEGDDNTQYYVKEVGVQDS